MKKELFDFLTTDLQFIKGVGPVLAARFDEVLGGRRILDFLLHKPAYVRPRALIDSVVNVTAGDLITIPVTVKSHKPGGKFKNGGVRPTQIICNDKFGATLTLQFFGSSFLDYWLEKLPIGSERVVSGRLEFNNYSGAVINHPDFIETPERAGKIPTIQAIYPSGIGLTQKTFANVRDGIFASLDRINYSPLEGESAAPSCAPVGGIISNCTDNITHRIAENNGSATPPQGGGNPQISDFLVALRAVHFPQTADDLLPNSDAMMKLAYSELFAHQAAIVISRRERKKVINQRSQTRNKKYDLWEKFNSILPFAFTGAQERVIGEIFDDMEKTVPMMRLVQGDVGSGKTIVAMAATIKMAEFGAQTAFLAPTDTLAQQHFAKIKPMCDAMGIVCDILTGRDKGAPRREKLTSLKSGRTKLVIGTHALFSDDVEYKDLGLVVIDEQHRFGVAQRESMKQKGNHPDMLALSATPIPRTLSMTVYGDMDISIVNEKPAGRLPIKTTKLPVARANELVSRLRPQIDAGAKVFWVCPLVEESEESDMMAAESRYEFLKKEIGIRNQESVGIVHGQMDKKKRDAVMAEFADPKSKMRVLVSTTVIEVGIDVPHATIMVIENAERFGMAALHQLRGRVGRGNAQSFCILMFGANITPDGMKRLDVLCETDDGFVIAEQDLMMRGTGELLGTKQSGWIAYNFVDYREHRDLFKLASLRAREMETPDQLTHDLMFIFGRETMVKS